MRNKGDVEYHRLGYGYKLVPAVNVKVRKTLADGYREFTKWTEPDEGFTLEWIEALGDDHLNMVWEYVVEDGWNELDERAKEIYGKHVRVYSEGRQGGWAYVDGINTDVESWDAIEFGQWRSFAKFARATADDIMYRVVNSIYCNEWEVQQQEAHDEWVNAEPNFPEGVYGT